MPLFDSVAVAGAQVAIWKVDEPLHELLEVVPAEVLAENFDSASEKRKREILGAQMAIRELIGSFKKICKEGKKPYLEGMDNFISISHTANFVAIGIAKHAVAIDIEVPERDISHLKRKFLSDMELRQIPTNNKLLPLLYWTCKECLYKIAPFQGIVFSEFLTVMPFELKDNFWVKGSISKADWYSEHKIHVIIAKEIILSTIVEANFGRNESGRVVSDFR